MLSWPCKKTSSLLAETRDDGILRVMLRVRDQMPHLRIYGYEMRVYTHGKRSYHTGVSWFCFFNFKSHILWKFIGPYGTVRKRSDYRKNYKIYTITRNGMCACQASRIIVHIWRVRVKRYGFFGFYSNYNIHTDILMYRVHLWAPSCRTVSMCISVWIIHSVGLIIILSVEHPRVYMCTRWTGPAVLQVYNDT